MKKKILSVVAVLVLAAILAVALVACIPSDPDKAAENLANADYLVIPLPLLGIAGVDEAITATNLKEGIVIVYFESSDAASDFYGDKDNEKFLQEELEELGLEDTVYKKQGKIVYLGTKEAVKAAR